MKVAINALAVRSRRHGVGRYVTNLVAALAKIDAGIEYVVVARKGTRRLFDDVASVTVETLDLPPLLRVPFEHSVLPSMLRQRGVDVIFGPAHTVPLLKTTRQVVSILDMSWFTTREYHSVAKRWYFGCLIPASLRRADVIVAISDATKRDIQKFVDVGAKPIITTPLGLDDGFSPSSPADVASALCRHGLENRSYVMNLGVFEPRKNQAGLVRAFARVVRGRAGCNTALVLAGSLGYGWRNSEIWRLVERLGLGSRVVTLDALPDEDIKHLLTGAQVFVYPSFYEGFGLPVLEAMACGAPVITSRTSSMPEVAGDAAVYVDPASDEELAAALDRVMHDESVRSRMRDAGLARARQFSWDSCARRTLEAFDVAMRV